MEKCCLVSLGRRHNRRHLEDSARRYHDEQDLSLMKGESNKQGEKEVMKDKDKLKKKEAKKERHKERRKKRKKQKKKETK